MDNEMELRILDLTRQLPDRQERRRYALLQASVEFYWRGLENDVDDWDYKQAISEADGVLAEIERRETALNIEPRPLLTACKSAMLAIKRVSLHVEGEASKELVAIYRLLQEAVQREEEQS